jgi:hypothetical protein
MKSLYTLAVSFSLLAFLSGCATEQNHAAILPPSAVPVINAVSSARIMAARLRADVPAENRAQVEDLSSTLATAQSALTDYAAKSESQSTELGKALLSSAKYKASARQNAKERDVILFLFALIFALGIGRFTGSFSYALPPPWSLIAPYLFLAGGFAAGYTLGRVALAYASRLIP